MNGADDIDNEEPKPKMCGRCGAHPDDQKCLDHYVGDELRPMQTKLFRALNDETLPHGVRGEIAEAADALDRAMQAAHDCTPNTTGRGTMRIKCAAILHNGVIYEGQSHCEIGLAMLRDGVCHSPYPGGGAQGFVTECGKFVRRAPVLMIAIRAGQVTAGKTCHPHHLFSEDLRGTTARGHDA